MSFGYILVGKGNQEKSGSRLCVTLLQDSMGRIRVPNTLCVSR